MQAAVTSESPLGDTLSPAGDTISPAGDSSKECPADLIARRLIWIRNVRGISQGDLAGMAHLSRSAVNDAESGQSRITIRTLYRLAEALDVNPAVLLGCIDLPAEIRREEEKMRLPWPA